MPLNSTDTTGSNVSESSRLIRLKERAVVKRNLYVAHIKSIHQLAQQANNDATVSPQLVVSGRHLDIWWAGFQAEDDAILDALCDLNLLSEYSSELRVEVSGWVDYAKAIAAHYECQEAATISVDGENNTHAATSGQGDFPGSLVHNDTSTSGVISRLPEIPLPRYDGDIHKWPAFRDRFEALIVQRSKLSNIEKFYYLIGCVHGAAADAIRGIPVSGDTYELAWATLVSRFDKPRLVASALVDILLQVPAVPTETLVDLNKFMALFNENVSVLRSLKLPDLGDFILFSLASRCLPASCRTLFESQLTTEYPTVSDLFTFLKARVAVLERVQGVVTPKPVFSSWPKDQVNKAPKWPSRANKMPSSSLVSSTSSSSISVCKFCGNRHTIEACIKFQSMSTDERSQWARTKRICFTCLRGDHWANQCKSQKRCSVCSRRHHTLLHPKEKDGNPTTSASTDTASTSLISGFGSPSVMLGTALVHVFDRAGGVQPARALIDSASQISAITATCAKRLGLCWSKWTAPITGLAGVPVVNVQGRISCRIVPRYSPDPELSFDAWVLPSITNDLPRMSLNSSLKDKYSHLALADPNFHITAPIDLLLGADLFSSVMDGRQIVVDKSLPAAFSSCFGWILIGPVSPLDSVLPQDTAVSLITSVEQLVSRFWHIEEPEVAPLQFTDAGQCEHIFKSQVSRDNAGRFTVPLPFRTTVLPNSFAGSRAVAVKRFERLEHKLRLNERLRAQYTEFMAEYLSLGHMSLATTPGQYFIPHHAVASCEDKFRVVFDASAQCLNGSSLNDALFAGPKLQQDIIDVLTRFRLFRHAFTTDIRKMYRQIQIVPDHRTYQHILWRSHPHDELVEYELNTVTYGVNCAPFLALRVLQEVADTDCHNFSRVQDALRSQTYVDDVCYGADTIDEVLTVQADLQSVLAGAGFELRKWASNTEAVLKAVPADFCVTKAITFAGDECGNTKVLGLFWHTGGDYFGCEPRIDPPTVFTKRGILSLTARIFDPLGLFAPTIFLAKHIMQRTWQAECSWDECLPEDIHKEWEQFVAELCALTSVRIPRYFNTTSKSTCSLYGFCDASQRGYAAVIFLRVHDAPPSSSIFLVGSKTKLAPIKSVTIPRLELNAAVLLARWMNRVHKLLAAHVNLDSTYAWTDSIIVLSWLTVPHETFKQYVSNRVYQIQTLLPHCKWRHVRSEDNPADCASRGLMPSALLHHDLYWNGPRFIKDPPHKWGSDIVRLPYTSLPDIKGSSPVSVVAATTTELFTRFSSYDNMMRVFAWILRFIANCRRQTVNNTRVLQQADLDAAHRVIVRTSQQCTLSDLKRDLKQGNRIMSKPLARLCPFIDSDGLIRVGGRLRHSSLPYNSRHPILLAKSSHLSILVCRRWHKVTGHSGPRLMSTLINRQYWIMSLRSVIYSVIVQCTRCVRLRASTPQPIMADLPETRVQQCRPFSRVGIDYAGPMPMRDHRLRKSRTYKVYIAVFVCFSVKAVHLELVSELSTKAFLAAFDRFVSRRGLPITIYSDCGTNFVGAAKQLRQLINSAEAQATITSKVSSCEWNFNPPGAPHFGGLWEAAVRSAKRLLVRIMGVHTFTYEEFTTVLCRVEAVLNSRPLTPASSDPHDLESLTPGHFLIGQPLMAIPTRASNLPERSITDRWKLLNHCHQAFWRRWSAEYLHTLQERVKWTDERPNIKVNDMVTIRDNAAPPLTWRLGRVAELLPGPDGVVRVARVLTSRGIVTRPVVKLVLLPTQ